MSKPQHDESERRAQRTGLNVFLVLVLLTAVEYVVAVSLDSIALLIVLLAAAAIGKCWAILVYFMHVTRLWRGEEAH